MSQPLVQVRGLSTVFIQRQGLFGRNNRRIRALDRIDLVMPRSQILGVVGESGCGKTTLGRSMLRLIEPEEGEVWFQGMDLLQLSSKKMKAQRRNMQMVFQNPYGSLDPRFTVRAAIAEPIVKHTDVRGAELTDMVLKLMVRVGLHEDHLLRYPHEFSGGQLQRIALARAVALNPAFLVLDEPTSALDVSVQAQILNLLQQLQEELDLTYMFISHDLSVIRYISDGIAVMYLGHVVEYGPSESVFGSPKHPYTEALLSATPELEPGTKRRRIILEGAVPSPANAPPGCAFHTRCPKVLPSCSEAIPPLRIVDEGHQVACILYDM